MSDLRWTGAATAVAQVDTITPGGTIEADDLFILTITGWDGTSTAISVAAGGTTVADVTAAMVAAWNASTHPLCTPITATDNTTNLTLTADTAGEAFSVAATTTEAGGGAADAQTFSRAATTASAGPKHWDDVNNWDTGALPGAGAGENVYIENADAEILYGLDQSGIANTLDSLNVGLSFTGKIGYDGASGFAGSYLQIKATAIKIGYNYTGGSPSGSSLVMIDSGATASAITVEGSGLSASQIKQSIRLLANNASTNINVLKGSVGVAQDVGETATIGILFLSYSASRSTDANVIVGEGVTLTTLTKNAGTCYLGCAVTTVNNDFGSLNTFGEGAITTLNMNGGVVSLSSSGTITTLNIIGGIADFAKSLTARTVTTLKIGIDGSLIYDPSVLTLTNDIAAYDATGNIKLTATTP